VRAAQPHAVVVGEVHVLLRAVVLGARVAFGVRDCVRIFAASVVIALAIVVGAIQFVATVALRERAVSGAWVRLVPEGVARRVERVDVAWMPQVLVLVLAGRALDEGDDARAQGLIARLGASDDRLALEGRLADARGDRAEAARDYLAAGDLDDIQTRVTALAQQSRFRDALTLQRALVARLESDPTQRDTLALAWYALGGLEQSAAYQFFPGRPERKRLQHQAVTAYEHALALSPAQERYMIAYGTELINVWRYGDARAVFLRAMSVDPGDATPVAGLGEADWWLHDLDGARAALVHARKLNANDPAVVRLAREIGA
jgi:tetratricopeptide (TPR) repeat protein